MKVRTNISLSEKLSKTLAGEPLNRSEICEAALWRALKGTTPEAEVLRLKRLNLRLRTMIAQIRELVGDGR